MRLLIVLLFTFSFEFAFAHYSIVTSLRADDCQPVKGTLSLLGSTEICEGQDSYAVKYKTYDLRGWVVLQKENLEITSVDLVRGNHPGYAPYIGDQLEWRYDKNKKLLALIFPLHGTNIDDPTKTNTVWVAACIDQNKLVNIGEATSAKKLRQWVDKNGPAVCNKAL